MKKRILAIIMAVVMTLSLLSIQVGAETASQLSSYEPQTYDGTNGVDAVFYKGDIITFTPDELVETPDTSAYWISSGFRITDQHHNNIDITSKYAEILEVGKTEGVYTKIKITSDKPVYLTVGGSSSNSISTTLGGREVIIYYTFSTLDATLCENSYDIEWNTDGGVMYEDSNPTFFEIKNTPAVCYNIVHPVKEGYHFSRWRKVSRSDAVKFYFYPQTVDYSSKTQKLTAEAAKAYYNSGSVIYDTNGGGYILTPENGKVEMKAEYISETTKYHCGTVTFDANGGTVKGNSSMMAEALINDDCEIYVPSKYEYTPKRDNYKFDGWYTDKTYTTPVPSYYNDSFKATSVTTDNPLDRSRTVYAKWTPLSFILGDVDGDSDVTILDATIIQKKLAQIEVSAYNEKAADTDADGYITVMDATMIQKYLAQMLPDTNIGKAVTN